MNRLACSCVASAFASLSFAGPLTPPAGPVAGTYKTLDQIEARTPITAATTPGDSDSLFEIDTPGSYYLTGDATAPAGFNGIEIEVDDVTIDLNGFTLTGTTGGDGYGIGAVGNRTGIRVLNGRVRGFDTDGILCSNDDHTVVEDVTAEDNGGRGITAGAHSRVTNCHAHRNGAAGFEIDLASRVSACVAEENGLTEVGPGFNIGRDSVISGCVADNNTGHGFLIDQGCAVESCTARVSGFNGISIGSGSTLRACVVRSAGQAGVNEQRHGIVAGNRCTLDACTVWDAADNGISVGNRCVIRGTAIDSSGSHGMVFDGAYGVLIDSNISSNDGYGVMVGEGCIVRSCVISGNFAYGVFGDGVSYYSVIDSVILGHVSAGISGGTNVTVRGSTIANNGSSFNGAAIVIEGGMIDGCDVSNNSTHGVRSTNSHLSVLNCRITNNSGDGVKHNGSLLARNSAAAFNGFSGFTLNPPLSGSQASFISDCLAHQNGFNGFFVSGGFIDRCVATHNDCGFVGSTTSGVESAIVRCFARDNVTDNYDGNAASTVTPSSGFSSTNSYGNIDAP